MLSRPRVTLTYAQSVDGRIATATGDSRWISGDETLTLAHELRRDHDAIMVGIGTVERDDPELTCRLPDCPSPLRVVLDTTLRLSPDSRIVKTADRFPTLVFCSGDAVRGTAAARLRTAGVDVEALAVDGSGIGLPEVLGVLAARRVETVMVEGGSAVITSFFRGNLVDRLIVVSAPMVIGTGTEAVGDLGVRSLGDARRGKTVSVRRMGVDVVWEIAFAPEADG